MTIQQTQTRSSLRKQRRAGLPWLNVLLIPALIVFGSGLVLYPSAASWLASVNQSKIIEEYTTQLADVDPSVQDQLNMAEEYNAALDAGVMLEAGAHKPTGAGESSDDSLDYHSILSANDAGLMGRVKIPDIKVDLPIYHGTEDDTLLMGAGHLEGSRLPIGGMGTHSVVTAHRGLADATMFDDLDDIDVGDRFTLEVFGEVLTYEIIEKRVVEPHDTDSLRPIMTKDLVTLVTCTPLGINSHRILVTGERVTPTPLEDLEAAGTDPEIPGFPWWAVGFGAGVLAAIGYGWYMVRQHRNT